MKHYMPAIFGLTLSAALLAPSFSSADGLSAEEAIKFQFPALIGSSPDYTGATIIEPLEEFVAKFYRWYVANGIEDRRLLFQKGPWTDEKRKEQETFSRKYSDNVRRSITQDYFDMRFAYADTGDGKLLNLFPASCEDEKNITCDIAWKKDQILKGTAKLIDLNPKFAQLRMIFPSVGSNNVAYKLMVRLKLEKGAWRIDDVTCLCE
jgi:hypothetical protein